jgi:hypothetical protein
MLLAVQIDLQIIRVRIIFAIPRNVIKDLAYKEIIMDQPRISMTITDQRKLNLSFLQADLPKRIAERAID